jgi:preprotein translocase subunit YajC
LRLCEAPLEANVLISPAFAQAAGGGDMGQWTGLLPIVLMFVLLYFMLIRPQMKRAKEHKAMTDALQKGEEVVTSGGFWARSPRLARPYLDTSPPASRSMSRGRGANAAAQRHDQEHLNARRPSRGVSRKGLADPRVSLLIPYP